VTRVFDDAQVRRLLRFEDLLPAVRQALMDLSAARVIQPLRSTMEMPGGVLFLKPVRTQGALAAKLITQFAGNAGKGLPTMLSTVILMDPDTGAPLAVMNGDWLTAMRTSAASAVAVDALMPAGEKKVALLGSGVLARAHARALREVRKISEIRVWSPTTANARGCANDVGGTACASAEEAVRGADIVVTVTTATTPILQGAWLKSGAFVCAVGAPRPTWRELDDTAMRNIVIADSRAAAETESGDVILSGAKVYAEIGEILLGTIAAPPQGSTIIFKCLGQAVEDAVAAELVYAAADASPPQAA
jgi:ornithine cyclodeaminase